MTLNVNLKYQLHDIAARIGLITGSIVAVASAVCPCGVTGSSETLFDEYQVVRPRPIDTNRVVRIIDIGETSIAEFWQWRCPHTDPAALVDRLTDAGAAAISFDVMFSEEDRTSPKRVRENWDRYIQRFFFSSGESAKTAIEFTGLGDLPDHDQIFAAALARSPPILGTFLTGAKKGGSVTPRAGFAVQGSHPSSGVPPA